jgi:HAD superfamily hydrolase (TIGR01549 family)
MPARAVFFDFGGTLGTLAPPIDEPWKAWSRVARELELVIPDTRIQAVNKEADRRYEGQIYAYHGRTQDFWRMRDMWVIDRLGITSRKREFFDALQAIFGDPTLVQLYPETMEVLTETRSLGFHTGVISNFTDDLLSILKHHGLDALFDSVTYSQAVGVQKPDSRVFAQALKRAGCSPAEAVHVGDSWEGDYLGATRAGMRAIWLNRRGISPPEHCDMVRDLHGILPLLSK